MSTPHDELTPAEQRLISLLVLLKNEPWRVEPAMTRALLARLRWQVAARTVLRVASMLAGAAGDSLALLMGRSQPRRGADHS